MTSASLPLNSVTLSLLRRIVSAWLIVAVLDFIYVTVIFGLIRRVATPMRLWQGVARAVLDTSAFEGGLSTAALGVTLHFCVALGWTLAWATLYQLSPALRRLVAPTSIALGIGVAYGLYIWLAMNRVILPFTHAKPGPVGSVGSYLVLLSHLTVIGPPIVIMLRERLRQ